MATNITAKHTPTVSVVMSVYNGEQFLRESIDSILNQTYKDFELIIIDDGSTDTTLKIIKSYKDSRIRIISRANKGLVASLNEGIRQARGKYVARQDADDVSLPKRLHKQVEYFTRHKGCVVMGTWFEEFAGSKVLSINRSPMTDALIRLRLLWGTCFGHGTVMFNREVAIAVGLYRKPRWPAEDYDFWSSLAEKGKLANLPEVLYRYRVHDSSISVMHNSDQQKLSRLIAIENRKKYLPMSAREIQLTAKAIRDRGQGYVDFVGSELDSQIAQGIGNAGATRDALRLLRLLSLKKWARVKLRLATGR